MWEPPFFPGIGYIVVCPMFIVLTWLSCFDPIVTVFCIATIVGASWAIFELVQKIKDDKS